MAFRFPITHQPVRRASELERLTPPEGLAAQSSARMVAGGSPKLFGRRTERVIKTR